MNTISTISTIYTIQTIYSANLLIQNLNFLNVLVKFLHIDSQLYVWTLRKKGFYDRSSIIIDSPVKLDLIDFTGFPMKVHKRQLEFYEVRLNLTVYELPGMLFIGFWTSKLGLPSLRMA